MRCTGVEIVVVTLFLQMLDFMANIVMVDRRRPADLHGETMQRHQKQQKKTDESAHESKSVVGGRWIIAAGLCTFFYTIPQMPIL